MHILPLSGKMDFLLKTVLRVNIFQTISLVSTTVHHNKCNKVSITKVFEGGIQDTGEITLAKGKIADFPGQVHLITE